MSALEAIGDRNNSLRFLAAEIVISLAHMTREEKKQFKWQRWWASHREVFTVYRTPESVRDIVQKYLKSDNELVVSGAKEVIWWLEK